MDLQRDDSAMESHQVTSEYSRSFEASDLAYIAVFAALIAALALVPAIPIGVVPITLQTLGVSLCGLVLGWWRGGAAVSLYILVGLAGIPVFAQGAAGLGILSKPSVGYLFSFIPAAIITGFLTGLILRKGLTALSGLYMLLALILVRLAVITPLGVIGMVTILRGTDKAMTFWQGVKFDMLFWPGDLLKSVVAVLIAIAIFKAFPRLMKR